MQHNLETILKFASTSMEGKHEKLRSFHYSRSGHVVSTNSHILFASKEPFDLNRTAKTYSSEKYSKGEFVETNIDFPDWKFVIPNESARKFEITIPKSFEVFKEYKEERVLIALDYTDLEDPFFKYFGKNNNTTLACNGKYLSEFAGQSVSVLVSSPFQPVVLLSNESKIDPLSKTLKEDILNEQWFYILMPIRPDEDSSNNEVYI